MQQGFAAKKAKAKAKRTARKLKKKQEANKNGDANMTEMKQGSEDVEVDDIDYTFHGRKGHAEKVKLRSDRAACNLAHIHLCSNDCQAHTATVPGL